MERVGGETSRGKSGLGGGGCGVGRGVRNDSEPACNGLAIEMTLLSSLVARRRVGP